MKSNLFLSGYHLLLAKLFVLFGGLIFFNACSTGSVRNSNEIIVGQSNTANSDAANNANLMNANSNSTQPTGEETMKRDLQIPGRFNCTKIEDITIEFTPVNTTSTINFEFRNENNQGVVSGNKLTFKCDKNRKLALLFTFTGNNGLYGIVFKTASGTVIADQIPIRQPLSAIPERVVFDFRLIGG
jgi:hypothetical protein